MQVAGLTGRGKRSIFRRLARDERGNVLIISAVAIIPMLAMIGGAIDASRLYMAHARLQQACDAGALAGRKAMADVNTLSTSEKATAKGFFDFNFPAGTYEAASILADYVRGATPGTVAGTASIVMPTTIMKLFGFNTVPMSVTCESTLLIPNTDVMFVLDVTGSMADIPSGDTVSKIDGLKQAVKDFFSGLGPGTASGPGRIRYGFMPYSSNVNVGKLVYAANPAWIVGGNGSENWHYQSRKAVTVDDRYISAYGTESAATAGNSSDSSTNWGGWVTQNSNVGNAQAQYNNVSQTTCNSKTAPNDVISGGSPTSPTLTGRENVIYPDNSQDSYYSSTTPQKVRDYAYGYTSVSRTCQLYYRDGTYTTTNPSTTKRSVTWSIRQKFSYWSYVNNDAVDTSSVVRNAAGTNPAYYTGYWSDTDPNTNSDGTATSPTISWGGCIEEASTVNSIVATSSITPPSGADDLNIDLIPDTTERRWKPFLPQVQYDRDSSWMGRQAWISSGFAACPREASRLAQYTGDYVATTKSSPTFNGYVNSLFPIGGTTHDIGLIWGARFLSPTGIFSSSNSDSNAPDGAQISRHIVFMTDGTLDTRVAGNDPWGITKLDGRVAPTSANDARNNETHNRRVQIICNSMKSKGFTIWVIGFGLTSQNGQPATLPQTLADCATDANHASVASNAAVLRARFQTIAETIGGLRLSS